MGDITTIKIREETGNRLAELRLEAQKLSRADTAENIEKALGFRY
ncbi:MAG: hypothetical protein QW487_07500 [Candidatus Bathyarchaeia archaeon]